jgi:hypothetical protein
MVLQIFNRNSTNNLNNRGKNLKLTEECIHKITDYQQKIQRNNLSIEQNSN